MLEYNYRIPYIDSWNFFINNTNIILSRLYSLQIFEPTNVEDLLFSY